MTALPMILLALAAIALLTRPWWRKSADAQMQRRAANVVAYRTRIAELDNEVASGLLDAESAAALKQELGAHLVEDAQPQDIAPAQTPVARAPIVALLILLPAFAVTWYGLAGSWRTQELVAKSAANPEEAQRLAVEGMVQKLAARLEDKADDATGWAMLGRSHYMLRRYAEAAQAYARANQLSAGQNPQWLVGEGESLTLSSEDRNLQGRPRELFEKALKLDPADGRALWYGGLAALQAEDYPTAQAHWAVLNQQPDLPQDLREVLNQRLAELSKLTGQPLPAAQPKKPAGPELALQIEVSLAPALAAKAPPGATLFVFAKGHNGPPMPLAVQRLAGAQLPLTVRLDDSMAMVPSLRLSTFDRWTVTARLTRGGTVQAESGDLEGQIDVSRADAGKPLAVKIDRVVP